MRTLASTLNDPTWMATDPISGDLFVTNGGSGSLFSPDIIRIQNPSSTSPTVSTYGTDGSGFVQLAFAPNGTLYTINRNNQLVSFGGTNTTQPATETVVSSLPTGSAGLVLGSIGSGGAPTSVYVSGNGDIYQVALPSGTPHSSWSPARQSPIDIKSGPDGCLYAAVTSEVLKLVGPRAGRAI